MGVLIACIPEPPILGVGCVEESLEKRRAGDQGQIRFIAQCTRTSLVFAGGRYLPTTQSEAVAMPHSERCLLHLALPPARPLA